MNDNFYKIKLTEQFIALSIDILRRNMHADINRIQVLTKKSLAINGL